MTKKSLPDVKTVSAPEVAEILREAESLAAELATPTNDIDTRKDQYQRLITLGQWLVAAGTDLHATIRD
ncbi:hypothetical protein [Streptomyces sp. NPDC001450]